MNRVYALYRGDTFIDLGTKQHLANKIGVKVSTIEYYMTPTHRKKIKGNGWIVIKIED